MKNESQELLKLGISMVFLSVLLTYIVFTSFLGKDIGGNFLDKTDNIQVDSQIGGLKELNNIEIIVPTATAFSLIEYHRKDIHLITCYICDSVDGEIRGMDENLCITSHLEGSVVFYVEYNGSYGLFDIILKAI